MKKAKIIDRISPVDRAVFYRDYVAQSKPVVITGLVDEWPALQKWDMDYFAENYGKVKPVTVGVRNGRYDFDPANGVGVFFSELENTINSIEKGDDTNGYAIITGDEVFPSDIKNDYPVHDYCKFGSYLRVRIFIGPKGTITAMHQDLFENLYTMIKGSKRIILFKPSDHVYRNSFLSKMPNFTKSDPEKPNYEKYPKMMYAQPYVVDLKAGETLYLPSLWWHYLRNIEESIAVSYWWAMGWKLPLAWAAAQYKKVMGI